MALILILAQAAVLLAPIQQVALVGPGTDTVQSDRVKTLEVNGQLPQELDWYASIGYRIVEVRGGVLKLERSSNSGDHHDYLVLLPDKKSRAEPRMNDAASRGFRFLPRALFVYYDLALWRESHSIGVVMEKVEPAGSSSRLQYQLVSGASSLGTIEKQISRAAKDGYRLVGIKEAVDETSDDNDSANMAVLEKRDKLDKDVREDAPLDLELMSLQRASPERLQKLTMQGFRIVFAQDPFLLLEKKPGVDARPEYAVIAERTRADFQRAMNDAVQRGFRHIPGTLVTLPKLWPWPPWTSKTGQWTVIMERTGDPGPGPEYIVAETEDEEELSNLVARGYTYLEGRIFMRLPQRGTAR